MAIRFLRAWMIDSSVYENSEMIVMRSAASRVRGCTFEARNTFARAPAPSSRKAEP